MNKSMNTVSRSFCFALGLVALTGALAIGCAAEQPDEEETASESSAAIGPGDIARRVRGGAGTSPDELMGILAEHARAQCRFTRDSNNQLSGPYGLITFTATVEYGHVTFVGLEAPHADTAIGTCIQQSMREVKAPAHLGFTRVKRFTIKEPGRG